MMMIIIIIIIIIKQVATSVLTYSSETWILSTFFREKFWGSYASNQRQHLYMEN
jgi:hypothetical protein